MTEMTGKLILRKSSLTSKQFRYAWKGKGYHWSI